ncbi:Fanconi anemia group A protein isoform X4 [Lepisosteus oculatus]|uniref:Fanconi anemia group A protein isoform X4 n=1 Tax=Lepisosteus oculatus TaxID=7918 RepID=UPI0035F524EC
MTQLYPDMSVGGTPLSGSLSQSSAAQKRSLAALLESHVSKKRPKYESEEELQEAAVQLLTRHQNLKDLLLEVSPRPCEKIMGREKQENGDLEQSTLLRAGGSVLVCVLQGQAARLGVPLGLLSARKVAERLGELPGHAAGSTKRVLLDTAKREEMGHLLQSVKELLCLGAFSCQLFCQELWKAEKPPILEVVWHLHKGNVITLEEIVESHPSIEVAVEWLFADLCALCGQPGETEVRQQIFSDVLTVLVRNSFPESQNLQSHGKTHQVCFAVTNDMLSWVLDAASHDKQEQQSPRKKAAKFWMNAFDVALYKGAVLLGTLQKFFLHSLTQILTYKPHLKVSDALGMQWQWSFAKTCPLLTSLYRKLFVLFSEEELVHHLRQVLETHEVNWQHVLSSVSTLLVCHTQAQHRLKDLLTQLLTKAFELYDLESLITAFLLARQASLEGPAVFMSYTGWYKMSFGSASGYHGNSKKSLVFLLKFLSDLVPFEPPQYLKVHVLHPPYVPTKYRSFLQEYVSLAKTRLADLKVSFEEMGLYEVVSGSGAPEQPQCQAQQDVEKAISLFEKIGRIPANVMEASIFRRPYYMSKFLPVLLTPRLLPGKPDARMAFIESLRKADKIPGNMHAAYLQACQKEKQRQPEGGEGSVEVSLPRGPLEQLQAELRDLTAVLSEKGVADDISSRLSLISETLKTLFNKTNDLPSEAPLKINLTSPSAESLETKVTDIILKNFCQNLMNVSKINPPNRQGDWASLFVKMLHGHRQLLQNLLNRLWYLICRQGSSLSSGHILGLSVFVVHLHESRTLAPLDTSVLGSCSESFAEALGSSLACNTEETMTFCLRFCVSAVSYGLCKFSASSIENIQGYIPKAFFKKLLYLIPRLAPEVRAGAEEEAQGNVWRLRANPCTKWRSSALALWRHPSFQTLHRLPQFQLTFQDWLGAELGVQRSADALTDPERQEYQQWACHQQYLPAPLAMGGCDGHLETACLAIFNAAVETSLSCRSTCSDYSFPEGSEPRRYSDTCYPDILSRLQEMVYDLEMVRARRLSAGDCQDGGHFLFGAISERCAAIPRSDHLADQLAHQQVLHAFTSILTTLPPSVLVRARRRGPRTALNCETFFDFVNEKQRNSCTGRCVLPYELTAHFFRGVLSASLDCAVPGAAVCEVLTQCALQCPLIIISAGLWWARLQPVLWSQWRRLSADPLPEELQRMADCHSWARSVLCGRVTTPASDSALILAASLHWALQRNPAGRGLGATLTELEEHGPQLLVFLLFFSLMDLITAEIHPKGPTDSQQAQECCADILKSLEDCGHWLVLFRGPSAGPYQIVYKMMSEMHVKLLPLAFYSLVLSLENSQLGCLVRAQDFLRTALEMYSRLVGLFVDGTAGEQRIPEQVDSVKILTEAQRFLLRTISVCPQSSFLYRKRLEDACGDLDPEVAAALSARLKPPRADLLCKVPDFL